MSNAIDGVFQKKEKFLTAFASLGNITAAAKVAGCHPNAHTNWMKNDLEYPARFADAKERSADQADQEIMRRAILGVDRPVFGTVYVDGKPTGKEIVGHIREYSDTLLIFWAKALRPEKYRERVEHSGRVGGPSVNVLQVSIQAMAQLPQADQDKLVDTLWQLKQSQALPSPDGNGEEGNEPDTPEEKEEDPSEGEP